MADFPHDAKRFILNNLQVVDIALLQLYCSGLILAPQKALVRREFEIGIPVWVYRLLRVEETWGAEL